MARIKGIDLNPNKRVVIALTAIHGVGRSLSQKVLSAAKISEDIKVKDLTDDNVTSIREELDKYPVEGDVRKEVSLNIKRLMEIGSYRGMRHRKGLPVRGQRTKTNARTWKNKRGARKVVANKKKVN